MNDFHHDFPASYAEPDNFENSAADELIRLRRLLLEPEQMELLRLGEHIDNHALRAQDVSKVLAEAMAIRSGLDQRINNFLVPLIEKALLDSVRDNPGVLKEAVAKVLIPAFGNAVLIKLRDITAFMNCLGQNWFSFNALKWRLESFKKKKSFKEILQSKTVSYQVEQVFLLKRDNGVVLQSLAALGIESADSDMLVSMLTAIRDFAARHFQDGKGQNIDILQFGDYRIFISQGPKVLLAALAKGDPRPDYAALLSDTLEIIHLQFSDSLDNFNIDQNFLVKVKRYMLSCLIQSSKEKKQKIYLGPWLLSIGAVFCIIAWMFRGF